MADFMLRFLLCNVFLCGIIGVLLLAKRLGRNHLSSRMQYRLWFLLPCLLTVPFLPFPIIGLPQLFSWLARQVHFSGAADKTVMKHTINLPSTGSSGGDQDFTLSVHGETSSFFGRFLLGLWITGMFIMLFLLIRSALRLQRLKASALPLQNRSVRRLYRSCLDEMQIHRDIPIYSTAFLPSPIITGLFRPCIYLPIPLLSTYELSSIRYMLLHELQHYKHKNAFPDHLMHLFIIVYWFNPVVWFARKEMRNDKEIACDTSVLDMLGEEDYKPYGFTLIDFAQKLSFAPFSFSSSLGGTHRQIKRRILNIASYEKTSEKKQRQSMMAFILIASMLFGLTPFLSTQAAEKHRFSWDLSSRNISYPDLSACFGKYDGSFVLYDLERDTWHIHNQERALLRVSPDSTYKIYDALLGLEEGVIQPDDSFMAWDGNHYPFAAWNADQTLASAMSSSVNWYFQAIDRQLSRTALQQYIQKIEYGNQDLHGNPTAYWMESSLIISPVEQVQLLVRLHQNAWGFSPENIEAVKESICLSSSDAGTFYGKTGTGCVEGKNINGWFIGYLESAGHTCFFATNIQARQNAEGSQAKEITMSILAKMHLWEKSL